MHTETQLSSPIRQAVKITVMPQILPQIIHEINQQLSFKIFINRRTVSIEAYINKQTVRHTSINIRLCRLHQ